MKKHFFILSAFVLLNATVALAAWIGDTLQPQKKDGYYLISKPEEYVWIANNAKRGDSFKLVNDIVFSNDKDSVNQFPVKTMVVKAKLDFNGYSVYGASSYGEPFIDCQDTIINLSYKNFGWEKYSVTNAEAFNLKYCKTIGNVVAEGHMRIVGVENDNIYISGYGIVDGVLENRISVDIEAKNIGSLNIHAVPNISDMSFDTLPVRGAVNYADISVKADSIGSVKIMGMPEFTLDEKFYKLANYGNITVDVDYGLGSVEIFGLSKKVKIPKGVHPDLYNEGNISVKSRRITGNFKISGLIGEIPESKDTLIFENALNRGKIFFKTSNKLEGSTTDIVSNVGGCFSESEGFIKNAVNQGDVIVSVSSVDRTGDIAVGGIIGKSKRCVSNWKDCVSGLSKVVNMGTVLASAEGASVGGVAGYTNYATFTDEDYPGRIMNSVNLGNVKGNSVHYLGGVVGYFDDSEASGLMNFGTVLGRSYVWKTGGIFGAIRGLRSRTSVKNVANLGNVYARKYKYDSDSIGGIYGASIIIFDRSTYNAGRVAALDDADDFNSIIGYEPPMANFYDWDVYYGADTLRKRIFKTNEAEIPLTTMHMQSNEFVKELNYASTRDSNANVWKLSKVYPYPIIAEVEDLLKDHQELLSIPPVRAKRSVASFGLSVDGMNVLVSGAKVGTPYAVFNLLGHVVSRGRLEKQNQMIPLSTAGTYIVKVGNASRKVTTKN